MHQPVQFVFKQGFIYGIGNVLTKLSGVILLPLYLKYINETEFGVVTLFETIFQFILILSSWGVKGGFMRWYHEMKSRSGKKELFFTTWMFNFFTSFIAVALVAVLLNIWSETVFRYRVSEEIILYFLAGSFFRLLYDVPFYLMKLEQRAKLQTIWTSLNILLVIGMTVYFLEFREMGLKGIYMAQMLAHGVTFLALIPFILNHIKPKFNVNVLKEMIQYGLPLAISNILTTILTLSDRHIINQYQNLGEVAGYGMAFKIANLVQMVVIASLITAYSNYFFKTLHDKSNMQFYSRFSRLFLILITFGGLGVVLLSPEIMMVISAGSEFFRESIILIPVLIAGLIFSGWRQLLTLPLNKHKKTRLISIILVTCAAINILLNFALVPVYGKMGASVSTLIAQVIGMGWFYAEVKKLESINFQIGKLFLLFMLWVVMVIAGIWTFNLEIPVSWLLKSLIITFMAIAMYLFKIIRKDEINFVLQFIKTGRLHFK
ncbi:lipopolysaccharide biosynthesis protein [Alkalitalea saponilacus]|uniref:Membrane protein involved in the export of O-antigen and teichoic acid n=1 Tax=Alkalitalea saponilacus TaxID=889453 RepID=A0A1T5E5M9_9BACT|nr:polysaccharide biosynthesis C-terminal domain-containing protein [Alkalitalea saponilacus]ASB49102.1 multidrug transporter MatE [Alkalitalea saponilacus]SKB79159.1 Membrane protein involved in the export of O-antigen and teichoic acid [Alkalitalea saponilacus]